MLVLSRKQRESVVVSDSNGFERLLKVTVLEINGSTVRLGFEVDPGVWVHGVKPADRTRGQNPLSGAKAQSL